MIEILHTALDPEAITARVRSDSNGAVVTFLGTTRDSTDGRRVLHLEYEAYQPMADQKLAEIADEMRDRWGIEDIAIAHRLGKLEIGDISLVVAVASPHRADAFAACQYSVDRIKQIVPIWKKEFFGDGEVWVGSESDHHLAQATTADS
ncbi:MAG: molybdenum cofactor biosynthesis protein MoaE [Chloroflexi bacterium]|nr:molybdenum cofactor biosynthesis protein MoaE [Chloroflexota bacterium]